MSSRRRSGARGKRAKRPGRWIGIQWVNTNVPSVGLFLELTLPASLDNQPYTLTAVRGFFTLANSGTASTVGGIDVACKLAAVHLDDAGVITDDIQGLDLNIEDIGKRQLFTYHTHLHKALPALTADGIDSVTVEVEVNVSIKMEGTLKEVIGLFIDASVTSRLLSAGYLRAWILI